MESVTTPMESVSQSPELGTVSIEPQIVTCERLVIGLNIDVLRQFCNELAVLSDEAKITISVTDGLRSRIVDPAHIAMVDTGIALEVLERFDFFQASSQMADDGQVAEFGLDVVKMGSYLKSLKVKDAILTLSVDLNTRKMTIDGPTGQRVMSLLDTTGMSDPKIPTLNLPTEVRIPDQKGFKQLLRQAAEISDHIVIRYDSAKAAMYLECEGDTDKMKSQVDIEIIRADSSAMPSPDGPFQTRDTKSLFPLEYLTEFVKVIPGAFKLTIGNDYPLKIEYGKTVYLLAPRIESGE